MINIETSAGDREVGHLSLRFDVVADGGMNLIVEEPKIQKIVIHLTLNEVIEIRDFLNELHPV